MGETPLFNELLETGLQERLKRERNSFLDHLRDSMENLFEQDLKPKVLREKLLELIENERMPGYGRYYR